jgi:hypothetical protein
MNAVYWGITALCIMKHKEALDAEDTIEYVMSCWDEEAGAPLGARWQATTNSKFEGAFGAHPGHDAHILSTLSAIQVLATHDALARIDSRVVNCTPPPRLPPSFFLRAARKQSFWACNSPRASLQATPLARRTHASSTVPCRRYRCSARSTASTASGPSPTSPRAATLTEALGASLVPRAMPHKVRVPRLSLPLVTALLLPVKSLAERRGMSF